MLSTNSSFLYFFTTILIRQQNIYDLRHGYWDSTPSLPMGNYIPGSYKEHAYADLARQKISYAFVYIVFMLLLKAGGKINKLDIENTKYGFTNQMWSFGKGVFDGRRVLLEAFM
jgi:hypothetical protein